MRFDCAGVELDPGGIGKGYAVDCMVDELRRRGFNSALVAGSESTVYGMGTPPEEPRGWRVGIKDPRNRRRTVDEVFLNDASLSTSGSTEKFFRAEGGVYAHIMDPRTGFPAEATRIGIRDCAARHRRRGVGQTVLHPGARVDGEAQAGGVSRVLLRRPYG